MTAKHPEKLPSYCYGVFPNGDTCGETFQCPTCATGDKIRRLESVNAALVSALEKILTLAEQTQYGVVEDYELLADSNANVWLEGEVETIARAALDTAKEPK